MYISFHYNILYLLHIPLCRCYIYVASGISIYPMDKIYLTIDRYIHWVHIPIYWKCHHPNSYFSELKPSTRYCQIYIYILYTHLPHLFPSQDLDANELGGRITWDRSTAASERVQSFVVYLAPRWDPAGNTVERVGKNPGKMRENGGKCRK